MFVIKLTKMVMAIYIIPPCCGSRLDETETEGGAVTIFPRAVFFNSEQDYSRHVKYFNKNGSVVQEEDAVYSRCVQGYPVSLFL